MFSVLVRSKEQLLLRHGLRVEGWASPPNGHPHHMEDTIGIVSHFSLSLLFSLPHTHTHTLDQQIVAVAVIYVAYSWVFKSKRFGQCSADSTCVLISSRSIGTSGNTPSTAGRTTGPPVFGQGVLRGVSESMVDSVCSAFPDIPRENVMYDLSKTRNPQLTVEKILTAGVLPAVSPFSTSVFDCVGF